MNSNHIQGVSVVSLNAGEKLGSVSTMYLNADGRSVTSLAIERGGTDGSAWLTSDNIHAIGPDALTIDDASKLTTAIPGNEMIELSNVIKRKVVTEGGEYLGQVASVELDAQSLAVTHYEVSPGFFKSNTMIPVNQMVNIGNELVIVSNDVSATSESSDESATSEENDTPMFEIRDESENAPSARN